jgi:hypothetical protein
VLIALFIVAGLVTLVGLIRMYARLGPRRFAISLAVIVGVVGAAIGIQRLTGCGEDEPRIALVDETVGGQRWLRHPRFAFHHPGTDFVVNDKLVEQIEVRASRCYAWTRGDRGELVVCTIAEPVASREQWFARVAAARRCITRAISARPSVLATLEDLASQAPVTDDVGWADGVGTAFMHHVLRNGASVRTKLFTIPGGLALMLAVSSGDDLAGVVASFERR